jgi:hypothetical protein
LVVYTKGPFNVIKYFAIYTTLFKEIFNLW